VQVKKQAKSNRL